MKRRKDKLPEESETDLEGNIQKEDIELNLRNILYDKDNLTYVGYVWCNKRKRIFKIAGQIQYHNEIGDDKIPRIEVYCDETNNISEIKACKCYGIIDLPNNFDYIKYVEHLK